MFSLLTCVGDFEIAGTSKHVLPPLFISHVYAYYAPNWGLWSMFMPDYWVIILWPWGTAFYHILGTLYWATYHCMLQNGPEHHLAVPQGHWIMFPIGSLSCVIYVWLFLGKIGTYLWWNLSWNLRSMIFHLFDLCLICKFVAWLIDWSFSIKFYLGPENMDACVFVLAMGITCILYCRDNYDFYFVLLRQLIWFLRMVCLDIPVQQSWSVVPISHLVSAMHMDPSHQQPSSQRS